MSCAAEFWPLASTAILSALETRPGRRLRAGPWAATALVEDAREMANVLAVGPEVLEIQTLLESAGRQSSRRSAVAAARHLQPHHRQGRRCRSLYRRDRDAAAGAAVGSAQAAALRFAAGRRHTDFEHRYGACRRGHLRRDRRPSGGYPWRAPSALRCRCAGGRRGRLRRIVDGHRQGSGDAARRQMGPASDEGARRRRRNHGRLHRAGPARNSGGAAHSSRQFHGRAASRPISVAAPIPKSATARSTMPICWSAASPSPRRPRSAPPSRMRWTS